MPDFSPAFLMTDWLGVDVPAIVTDVTASAPVLAFPCVSKLT